MGHIKAAKHKIVLKDPDTPPFKERFRQIPPPQLDEVRCTPEDDARYWGDLAKEQPMV